MKNNWIYLSYPLCSEAHAYGGGSGFKGESDKQISLGDSCNTSLWSLSNHMGTHIDFPRHFAADGKSLDDYDPGFFISNKIYLFEIAPVEPGQIIGPQDLNLDSIPKDIEALLVKTGFGQFRGQTVYSKQNPGFYPDLADALRARFPGVRIMGFDSISLSSVVHRDLGREAHRAFLDHEHSILPLEDMDLTQISNETKIYQLVVAPLLVSGADGSPCTVMAKIK